MKGLPISTRSERVLHEVHLHVAADVAVDDHDLRRELHRTLEPTASIRRERDQMPERAYRVRDALEHVEVVVNHQHASAS